MQIYTKWFDIYAICFWNLYSSNFKVKVYLYVWSNLHSNAKKISDGGNRILIGAKDIEKLNDFYDMRLELSEPILTRQHDRFYDKVENNDQNNSEDSEDSDN